MTEVEAILMWKFREHLSYLEVVRVLLVFPFGERRHSHLCRIVHVRPAFRGDVRAMWIRMTYPQEEILIVLPILLQSSIGAFSDPYVVVILFR